MSSLPLRLEFPQKELTVSEFALTSLIAERVQSEGQVVHLHFLQQAIGVRRGLSPPSMCALTGAQ